jgi:hypothetical protein
MRYRFTVELSLNETRLYDTVAEAARRARGLDDYDIRGRFGSRGRPDIGSCLMELFNAPPGHEWADLGLEVIDWDANTTEEA